MSTGSSTRAFEQELSTIWEKLPESQNSPVQYGPNQEAMPTLSIEYPPSPEDLGSVPSVTISDLNWILRCSTLEGDIIPKKLEDLQRIYSLKPESLELNQTIVETTFMQFVFGVLRGGYDLSYLLTRRQLEELNKKFDYNTNYFSAPTVWDSEAVIDRIRNLYLCYCHAKGLPPNALSPSYIATLESIVQSGVPNIDNPFGELDLPDCFNPMLTEYYPSPYRCLILSLPNVQNGSGQLASIKVWVHPFILLSKPQNRSLEPMFYLVGNDDKHKDNDISEIARVLQYIVAEYSLTHEDCFIGAPSNTMPWINILLPKNSKELLPLRSFHFTSRYIPQRNNFGFKENTPSLGRIDRALELLRVATLFKLKNPDIGMESSEFGGVPRKAKRKRKKGIGGGQYAFDFPRAH